MSVNPTLLSHRTVYANLKVLSELRKGEKITIDHNTGVMAKHQPYYGETVGRWWSGAFNTDTVKQTFSQAFDVIQIEDDTQDVVRTYGHLADLIPAGYEGIETLRETYKAEKKSQATKDLKGIIKLFKERVKELQKAIPVAVSVTTTSVSATTSSREEDLDEKSEIEPVVALEEVMEVEEEKPPVRNRRIKKIDQRALIDPSPQQKTAKKASKWSQFFCCVKGEN